MKRLFFFFFAFFFFTACVEISDDLSIKSDGSGTFKYTVNLSDSKVKVNSILALDSLDGKKVPSIAEIKDIINEYKTLLETKSGISNVKVETDFNFFILKFQCDFDNVSNLQKAIKEIAISKDKKQEFKEINHTWLSWDGTKLVRSVPNLAQETIQKLKKEDVEALKKGKYVSITRFDRIIDKSENTNVIFTPDKSACMLKTNPYSLINNVKLLENTIYLTNTKKTTKT